MVVQRAKSFNKRVRMQRKQEAPKISKTNTALLKTDHHKAKPSIEYTQTNPLRRRMHSHQDQKAVQGKKKRKALTLAPDHSEKRHPNQ